MTIYNIKKSISLAMKKAQYFLPSVCRELVVGGNKHHGKQELDFGANFNEVILMF